MSHMSPGPVAATTGEPAQPLNAERREAVQRLLLTETVRHVPATACANVVGSVCAAAVMSPALDLAPPLAWAVALGIVAALRLCHARPPTTADAAAMARQARAITWLATAQGLTWGILPLLLVPAGNIELQAFAVCLVTAAASSGAATHFGLPLAGRLFAAAALLPASVSFMMQPGGRTNTVLAVLCVVYLAVLLVYHRRSADMLASAFAERMRNEQLTADMETVCARLSEAVAAAENASRSKSDFLANMSHEIRTPMNAVLGLSAMLAEEGMAPAHHESVVAIRESADVLLRIINEVLDLSQIEAGRVTLETAPFGPRKLVRDAVALIAPRAAAKGVAVEVEWDDTLPEGLGGDAGRVRQVLLNLLGNAVKFTERGRVVVAVRRLGADEGVAAGAGEGGGYPGASASMAGPLLVDTEWEVRDSGIGISPEALRTLFRDFAQADASIARRFGGSGLGLAISRRLVALMGGTIAVRSQPGVGSTFHFRLALPVAAAPAADAPDGETASALALRAVIEGLGRPLRVLLAEDNPINQLVARKLLAGFDMRLDIVGTGVEAVEACGRTCYDLIYMDMRMPDMDGPEATREIRRLRTGGPRIPILAFTANAFEEDMRVCREAGMDDFVSKPVRKAAFVEATLRALARVPADAGS